MTVTDTVTRRSTLTALKDGVGESAPRPDGVPKVDGSFIYSSDEFHDGSLWGVTLRSPHARARLLAIDTSTAEGLDGVAAVLTHQHVPGSKTYGMMIRDQPVLAFDEVRYQGEPVAIVAATHPEIARRACSLIDVTYEQLEPITDPELAVTGTVDGLINGGLARHVRIRHGDVYAARPLADVTIEATYEMRTQDPAFLGPESGLAVPTRDGGIELYVSCQNLHHDQDQVAACLGLPTDKVRLVLSGVGGAFGGKEDLNVHVHACMLALHTGRPVRMVYDRQESFFGHVHRHPAVETVELGATDAGDLVFAKIRLVLDGGAYASTSRAVIGNACDFAAGAYSIPNVEIDGFATYTNNPPCGAMRGFGIVQSCFGIESGIDRLAIELDMDPLALRLRNAIAEGDKLPTGQAIDGPAPAPNLLRYLGSLPIPEVPSRELLDPRLQPGGVGNATRGEGVVRGVGYALGMKAIGLSGSNDTCTAQVTMWIREGEPVAEVYCAATELGQGVVTLESQIVRTELGVRVAEQRTKDTDIAAAGPSSASRQSWMTSGAVLGACDELRRDLLQMAGSQCSRFPHELKLDGSWILDDDGLRVASVADVLGDAPISRTFTYYHRHSEPNDPETGQGNAHIAFAFVAHRAVVDVDVELGLVRVVELATAQDVGKAMNRLALEGQLEGGAVQGLGLAVMEELQIVDGEIQNPSFTDYLIPTTLDIPSMHLKVFETPHPDAPYGLNGVAELPNLSSTPAIMNALRNATGLELVRAPVRPADFIVTGNRAN